MAAIGLKVPLSELLEPELSTLTNNIQLVESPNFIEPVHLHELPTSTNAGILRGSYEFRVSSLDISANK